MKKTFTTIFAILFGLTAFAQFNTTKEDRAYWNGFVDYVEVKGWKGSMDLNRKDLNISQSLFKEYNKINNKAVDYSRFVVLVQSDIIVYRKQALEQIRISRIKHVQNPAYPLMFRGTDAEFMTGLSVIDGFAGVQTTAWRFPKEVVLGIDYVKTNDIYASNNQK